MVCKWVHWAIINGTIVEITEAGKQWAKAVLPRHGLAPGSLEFGITVWSLKTVV